MKQTYILGVGHNTPVLIDLALSCGYDILGLYHYDDSRNGEMDHGYQILGSFDDMFDRDGVQGKSFVLSMGDNKIRSELAGKILKGGGLLPSLIHPAAVISRFASIAQQAVYIFPFTFVQSDAVVGNNTILLSHVNISHNTSVGENCFVAGGTMVGAYVDIGDNVFIGQHATIVSQKVSKIGDDSFIGAGSLVLKDVASGAVVYGVPAK
jgi:UDP-perosamine 4-acetyltransferase